MKLSNHLKLPQFMFIFFDYFLLAGLILEPEFVRCYKVRLDTTLGTCLAHFVFELGRAPLANTCQTKHMITVFKNTEALVCFLIDLKKRLTNDNGI